MVRLRSNGQAERQLQKQSQVAYLALMSYRPTPSILVQFQSNRTPEGEKDKDYSSTDHLTINSQMVIPE